MRVTPLPPLLSLRWRGALASCAGVLVLSAMSDAVPDNPVCRVRGSRVRIDEDSRLVDAPGGRLELSPGRALACQRPEAQRVLAALELALADFPRERLGDPVHVHLDPRLPARQAPLSGIEVHVTSRELLVARTALDQLPIEAWRHELFHALAVRLPPLSPDARSLWLTVEEAVVQYLTSAVPPAAALDDASASDTLTPAAAGTPRATAHGRAAVAAVLPLGEWLASPAYDPHPLAAELARALRVAEPRADEAAWIDCLAADRALVTAGPGPGVAPSPRAAAMPEGWAEVWDGFMGPCSGRATAQLAAALDLWWGAPRAREPNGYPKAAARWLESR